MSELPETSAAIKTFEAVDANGSGFVSELEFDRYLEAHTDDNRSFGSVDTDNDGVVTVQELNSSAQELPGAMTGR